MTKRIIAGVPLADEGQFELSLRPRFLREYIGQKNVKENLEVAIAAARKYFGYRKSPTPSFFTRFALSG